MINNKLRSYFWERRETRIRSPEARCLQLIPCYFIPLRKTKI